MQKVVINTDYGGFGLSPKAVELLFKIKGWHLIRQDTDTGFTHFYKDEISNDHYFTERDLERNDLDLVKVVEELGKEANGHFASLKIVEIPRGVVWDIVEYDGMEHVAEKHRTWR